MKRFTTIAASLLAMFVISACGDDSPTEPSSPNGYVVTGDGYSNTEVVATSTFALVTSSSSSVLMTGNLGGEITRLDVIVNGNTAKDYTWTGNNEVLVSLTVGIGGTQKIYTGSSGKTTITSVGSAGGKLVGTFAGTLVNTTDATKKIEINGRFDGTIQ